MLNDTLKVDICVVAKTQLGMSTFYIECLSLSLNTLLLAQLPASASDGGSTT